QSQPQRSSQTKPADTGTANTGTAGVPPARVECHCRCFSRVLKGGVARSGRDARGPSINSPSINSPSINGLSIRGFWFSFWGSHSGVLVKRVEKQQIDERCGNVSMDDATMREHSRFQNIKTD